MPTDLQPAVTTNDFAPVLSELAALTRDHLLQYRLEVGRLILDQFFGGSLEACSDRSHAKQTRFADFLGQHPAELDRLGLKEHTLRQCVAVRTVFLGLPPAAKEQLGYTRTLALTRMAEPTTRARLALAAVAENWTVAELKQTIDAARAGHWYDTDPLAAGVQARPAPADAEAPRPPQPGRLVVRAEKWSEEFDAFAAGWASVGATRPTRFQRLRLKNALAAAIARLQTLQAGLDG